MKDGQPGQKYQFQHRFCSSCSRSKLIEKGYKRKDNRMKHLKGTQFVQLQNKDISLVYTSYCCKTISPYEHLNKWVSKCLESKPHVYFDIALNCCSYVDIDRQKIDVSSPVQTLQFGRREIRRFFNFRNCEITSTYTSKVRISSSFRIFDRNILIIIQHKQPHQRGNFSPTVSEYTRITRKSQDKSEHIFFRKFQANRRNNG